MRLGMTRRKWGRDECVEEQETHTHKMTGKGKGSVSLKLEPKNNIFCCNRIGQPSKCHFFPLFMPSFVCDGPLRGLKCIEGYLFKCCMFAVGLWLRCGNVGQAEKKQTLTPGLLEEAWPQQRGHAIRMSGYTVPTSIPTGLYLTFQIISEQCYVHVYAFCYCR